MKQLELDNLLFLMIIIPTISTAKLPPLITHHPDDVIFGTGETFQLHCIASTAEVKFIWLQNGVTIDLTKSNTKAIGHGSNGTIEIVSAGSTHEGYYQCKASNLLGTALSRVVQVKRARLDGANSGDVIQYNVRVGDSLRIPCETGDTFPKPQVSWNVMDEKTERAVPLNARVQTDPHGNLHFMNVVQDDYQAGKVYVCHVHNPYLNRTNKSSFAQINLIQETPVTKAPQWAFKSGHYQVAIHGKEITLTCIFHGFPTPRVTWSKKYGRLPLGRHMITNSSTRLTITNVQWQDEGGYECRASNEGGEHYEITTVDVQSAPVFAKPEPCAPELKLTNLNVSDSETASFICKVNAEPKPSIEWFINGIPIESNSYGWIKHSDYYYYFAGATKKMNWKESRQICLNRGGDLASIHSEEEHNWIQNRRRATDYWIGLNNPNARRKDDDDWTWSDGSPKNWVKWETNEFSKDEPNNRGEACAHYGYETLEIGQENWYDDDFSESKRFICKRAPSLNPRYAVTHDHTNFTVHNACLNCGEGKSDVMVLQCNASNRHGYIFSQAYLNILQESGDMEEDYGNLPLIIYVALGLLVAASIVFGLIFIAYRKIKQSTSQPDTLQVNYESNRSTRNEPEIVTSGRRPGEQQSQSVLEGNNNGDSEYQTPTAGSGSNYYNVAQPTSIEGYTTLIRSRSDVDPTTERLYEN